MADHADRAPQVAQDGTGALVSPAALDNAVLELALRVGDALLSAGMSAHDVVMAMLRIADAYGLQRVYVDVTYTSISVSHLPGPAVPPLTFIRIMQPGAVDLTKVRQFDKLCDDIEAGLPIGQASAAFERIRSASHPYPWWVTAAGNAGVGAAVTLLFTTSWKIIVFAFLTGCLVDRVLTGFDRLQVPLFFQQLGAAVLITMVAAGLTFAGSHGVAFFTGLDANLIVLGGIVMLVAGMVIVGAVQDAIDQFYVTASARMFDVVMRTVGIVAGIVAGLRLAQSIGVSLSISASPVALGALGAQFAGAALIAAFFALWSYADVVTIQLAAGMGLLGWAGYTFVLRGGAGEVPASGTGALLAALVATVIVRRTNVPGFGLIGAALLPLVPGLSLYKGLLQLVGTSPGGGQPAAGAATLLLALGVALGIAAGATLGTYLGRPIMDQLGQIRLRTRTTHRRSPGRS